VDVINRLTALTYVCVCVCVCIKMYLFVNVIYFILFGLKKAPNVLTFRVL